MEHTTRTGLRARTARECWNQRRRRRRTLATTAHDARELADAAVRTGFRREHVAAGVAAAAAEIAAAAARDAIRRSSSAPRSHVSHTTTHMDVEPFRVPVAAEPAARPADADKTRPGLEWEGHKAQLTAGKRTPAGRRRRRGATGGGRRPTAHAVDARGDAGCAAAGLRPPREGAGGAAARARMLCVQRAGGNQGGGGVDHRANHGGVVCARARQQRRAGAVAK